MAGRSAHVRRKSTDLRVPDRILRRSRSQEPPDAASRWPPSASPAHLDGFLHPDLDVPRRAPSPSPAIHAHLDSTPASHLASRLAFLGDMLPAGLHPGGHGHSPSPSTSSTVVPSISQRSATTPIPSSLLPARSHSRGDSGLPLSRDGAHSPVPGSNGGPPNQPIKSHTSPSKPSSTRTYDAKLVSREMHRLGNLAHLPSIAPSLSAAASSTIALAMPAASTPNLAATLANEGPWQSIHVLVLPLFNGEPIRMPIEDLNQLVRRHLSTVVSAAPGKALGTLEHDIAELVASGMVTLNARLNGVDDSTLIPRIVELWSFFWTQVLPYLEGALLPLQTDPILSSLSRAPKAHRPSDAAGGQNGKGSSALLQTGGTQLDVRALALVAFRDRIVLPLYPRLYARLTNHKDAPPPELESHQARLQQMLLVLVSQRPRHTALSLTLPPPASHGETAMTRLLRALHAPLAAPRHPRPPTAGAGAPSFLSAGLPRDRRGRIAQKHKSGAPARSYYYSGWGGGVGAGGGYGNGGYANGRAARDAEWDEAEADTPRGGVTFAVDAGRERDKEFLESLRSPDPENTERMTFGGWVPLSTPKGDEHEEEDEDEYGDEDEQKMQNMGWDKAQAMVERMVQVPGDEPRRRAPPIEGYKV